MADRVRVLNVPAVARLEEIAARIEQTGRDDLDDLAAELLDRAPKFTAGAHLVQLHGVTGTSTGSAGDALRAWARAARRKVARMRDEAGEKTG